MEDRVTAGFTELMRQAPETAKVYLLRAKQDIDSSFGEGFAQRNPALVAAYMQTAATDYAGASNGKVFGSALDRIADALDNLADAIRERGEPD